MTLDFAELIYKKGNESILLSYLMNLDSRLLDYFINIDDVLTPEDFKQFRNETELEIKKMFNLE